jgi:hypothetical protein
VVIVPPERNVGFANQRLDYARGVDELGADFERAHAASIAAGEDGYVDPSTGLWVFNMRYLEQRGFCCDNGCRHCPYAEG